MTTRAIFLDRDGVLNDSIIIDGKPFSPRQRAEVRISEHAAVACQMLRAAGFKLICVTNQPDVSRGFMTAEELDAINRVVQESVQLDEFRVCPHSDENRCNCRKPKPGLLLAAAADHNLDMTSSYMIGDRWRDVDAGVAAGCKSIFIDKHYDERQPQNMVFRCENLLEATKYILEVSAAGPLQ